MLLLPCNIIALNGRCAGEIQLEGDVLGSRSLKQEILDLSSSPIKVQKSLQLAEGFDAATARDLAELYCRAIAAASKQ